MSPPHPASDGCENGAGSLNGLWGEEKFSVQVHEAKVNGLTGVSLAEKTRGTLRSRGLSLDDGCASRVEGLAARRVRLKNEQKGNWMR
jgi:hypothetical protein